MYFQEKIKAERMKKNMSQQELGNLLNISRQSVSKWERGEGYPNIETLMRLGDIFNITIDELLKGDDSLKEKIIEDGKQLAYPKTKIFFEILLVLGVLIVITEFIIGMGNKFFGLHILFIKGSIVYLIIPVVLFIAGSVGSKTLAEKYK
ncbi:helix-turn-helix domain-containing protein [Bacillus paranthracis]|nr:helix-turn-helix transcriptional regulator [Bacillus paranthracis]MCR6795771.1 helix-turn-helix domain-containing protein [Bacillus paranthracis]MED1167731.1 helix-turn-helix transcriptional regulator [Bacillus paranthracis]